MAGVASRWGQSLRWGYFAWSTTPGPQTQTQQTLTAQLEIQAAQPNAVRQYTYVGLFPDGGEQKWGSFQWGMFKWGGKAPAYNVLAPEWTRSKVPEAVITRKKAVMNKYSPGFASKAEGLFGLPQKARWRDTGTVYLPSVMSGATEAVEWSDAGSIAEVFYTWGGTLKWGTFRWRG